MCDAAEYVVEFLFLTNIPCHFLFNIEIIRPR